MGGSGGAGIRPRRSVLYVPGGNARMHEKARNCPADGVVIDLEDSVAPEAKLEARALTVATVAAGGFGPRELALRVNPPGSPWFEEDLIAAGRARPDAVLITKLETPEQLRTAEALLDGAGVPPQVRIWAMIETPRGILNCQAIVEPSGNGGSRRLTGLVVGTNDIGKNIRARPRADRLGVLPFLSHAVLVARACGLFVLDGVFNDFSDEAGLESECSQGRDLGFDGKTLIHPAQIDTANRIFSPDLAEVEEARRIIAAFGEPQNRGKGAIRLDGRMVELLHAEIAAQTLALAGAIAARQAAD